MEQALSFILRMHTILFSIEKGICNVYRCMFRHTYIDLFVCIYIQRERERHTSS